MSLLKVNEITDLSGVIPDGVGRIVQIVRATDTTDRTTASTSFVDTGMSVTITPTKTSSVIYVFANVRARTRDSVSNATSLFLTITDSTNVSLSGAEEAALSMAANGATLVQLYSQMQLIGFDSPASTSAQTYKLRFRGTSATDTELENATNTGQLIAIEVAV